MPEKQIDLDTVPASAVAYEKPYCRKHRVFMNVVETVCHPDHARMTLRVVRKCLCPKCSAEGLSEPTIVSNSREFTE